MLIVQQRIRELLTADPWFQDPVKVHIEDKGGLTFLHKAKLDSLANPVVVIRTADGTADTRPMGTLFLTETLTLLFVECPTYNATSKTILDGVQAAMHVLHEAILWPNQATPGNHRVRILGHGATEAPSPAVAMHTIELSAPLQIVPATPARFF